MLALLALALPAFQEPVSADRFAPALAPFEDEIRAGIEPEERRPALEGAVTEALGLPAGLRFELRWGSYASKSGALSLRGAILGEPFGALELETRVAVDLEQVSLSGLLLLADELQDEETRAVARERLHLRLAGLDAVLAEIVATLAEVRAVGAELMSLHLDIEQAAGPVPSMRLHGVLTGSDIRPRQAHGLRALPPETAMPRERAGDGAARCGGGDLVIGRVETTRVLAESVASLLALERRYAAASVEVRFLSHVPDDDRFVALLSFETAGQRQVQLQLATEWLDPAERAPLEPAALLTGARVPLAHVLDALERARELAADEALFGLAAFAPEEEGDPATLLVATAPAVTPAGWCPQGRLFELSLPLGEGAVSARELELERVRSFRGGSQGIWRASLPDGRGVELYAETVFCSVGYEKPAQRFGARKGDLLGGTILPR